MLGNSSSNRYHVDSDDATWILTSAFIIFTMQSGFGLLESGLVSRKNEVNIMVKNAIDVIFGGLAYWMFGFAFSFGDDAASNAFCGMGHFFTDVDESSMGYIYSKYVFQLSFATTATTIVSGAMAERTNIKAYIAFSFLNTLTYCFPAHWIWADNGWLKKLGAVDIAGSSAVHVVGGVSGLVATMYLKPRTGHSFDDNPRTRKIPCMASPTNVLLGTFMLWWGWLGFNCGSTFGISGEKWKLAARSAVCTINSSIGGGISGIAFSYLIYKNKVDIPTFVTGILGGLVGITAICALTRPKYALVIGFIGGLTACSGCKLLKYLRIDDPVSCVPVHFFAGIWSLIAVAFFLEKDTAGYFSTENGIINGGRWSLLGIQIALAVSCSLWSGCITFVLLFGINKIIPVRLSLEDELKGADEVEHNILHPAVDDARLRSAYGSRISGSHESQARETDGLNAIDGITLDQDFTHDLVANNDVGFVVSTTRSRLTSSRCAIGLTENEHVGEENDGFELTTDISDNPALNLAAPPP